MTPFDSNPAQTPQTQQSGTHVLITAGPTHEPIDAVRFLGNRSSGRMGAALADECARRGWRTTLLLGPAPASAHDSRVETHRFRTCADLQALLRTWAPQADVLIMAAAVADYRPRVDPAFFGGKFRRKNEILTLELEPTPDLLAEVASRRRPSQLMVGFALEPREEMLAAARAKMARKRIDLVVANPLETMDSPEIEATVLFADGTSDVSLPKGSKELVAPALLDQVQAALVRQRTAASGKAASTTTEPGVSPISVVRSPTGSGTSPSHSPTR